MSDIDYFYNKNGNVQFHFKNKTNYEKLGITQRFCLRIIENADAVS